MNIKLFLESLNDKERAEIEYYILEKIKTKTTVKDFLRLTKVSTRLRTVLIYGEFGYYTQEGNYMTKNFEYIEEITEERFRKCRNAGNKSWNELKTLLIHGGWIANNLEK